MSIPFSPQLIGETEKTLNALLRRFLEGTGLTELHQALVHEAGHHVEDVDRLDRVAVRGDRFGGVQPERGVEHGQSAEHGALALGECVHAPRDRRQQRLLAWQHGSSAAGEEPERVVETGRQRRDGHRSHACGGELDRQRDAVQAGADLRDVGSSVLVDGKVGACGAGPVDEQPHGVIAGERLERGVRSGLRCPQRRDPPGDLARHAERLAARDQDTDCWTGTEEPLDELSNCVEDVLGVVERDQRRAVLVEVADQPLERIDARRRVEADG